VDRLCQGVENFRVGPSVGIVPCLRNVANCGGESEIRPLECGEAATEAIVVACPGPFERTCGRPAAGKGTRRRHRPTARVPRRSALTPTFADEFMRQDEQLLDKGGCSIARRGGWRFGSHRPESSPGGREISRVVSVVFSGAEWAEAVGSGKT
jgi:hypothetical protein